MFWLVDMRLHFHFAESDLFLGLEHSNYIYVQVRQNGMPKILVGFQLANSVFGHKCYLALIVFVQIRTVSVVWVVHQISGWFVGLGVTLSCL